MSAGRKTWSSDTVVSMPVPPIIGDGERTVEMGGFVFTANGLAHDLTEAHAENLMAEAALDGE